VTVGHFQWKLPAIHILYAVCIRTSVLTYTIRRDFDQVERAKCIMLGGVTVPIFLQNVK